MNSSRASINQSEKSTILEADQALIPQSVKKNLQSKFLMQHYQQKQFSKANQERIKLQQKNKEMEYIKRQQELHLREMQQKKMRKQYNKNEYAKQYDRMISEKKQKEYYEKQKSLQLQKKMIESNRWIGDFAYNKQIQKIKRYQYGKQLQNHLRLQQQRRIEQANKIKEQRLRINQEYEEQLKKQQIQKQIKYKKQNMFQIRQNQILGVKDIMNWSGIGEKTLTTLNSSERPLTPRMQRMLKVQQQQMYQKGLSIQYKSENQRKYFQKQNPQRYKSTQQRHELYNPITNPIQYKYKNPNILKMLSNKE